MYILRRFTQNEAIYKIYIQHEYKNIKLLIYTIENDKYNIIMQ